MQDGTSAKYFHFSSWKLRYLLSSTTGALKNLVKKIPKILRNLIP
jgi:hypothetical protein